MREIRKHTRTQSQFLRLRRTKIGLRDFRTVKVIGKGAFGEVSFGPWAVAFVFSSSSPPSVPCSLCCWLSMRICLILVTVFTPFYPLVDDGINFVLVGPRRSTLVLFSDPHGLQPLIMTLPTGNLLWNVLASVCRPRSEERIFLMRDAYTRFV